MRGFLSLLFIFFSLSQTQLVLADALPISQSDYDKVFEQNQTSQNYYEKEIDRPLYIPKTQDEAQHIEVNYYLDEIEQKKLEKQAQYERELKKQAKLKLQKQKEELKAKAKIEQVQKKEENKRGNSLFVNDPKDRILSESTRKISAIYPIDDVALTNTYPGYRGPNQLVIYNRDFGRTTQTQQLLESETKKLREEGHLTGVVPRDKSD